tara:strand:+ start:4360 stop:4788 length:429 start_codon:yes stop_codon:yes gene_type:complete
MKITGVKKIKVKLFKNNKGDLLKYISKKSPYFKSFGEVYFNEINFKKKKGWILHKKNQCIICVCYGEVKFKLIDGRKKSKSFNKENNITLSKINHTILIIPPGIWFSFTTNKKKSIFANLIDRIHTDKESSKANKVKNYEIK